MPGTLRTPDEGQSLAQEVQEMKRLTPAQRVEAFCSIMEMIRAIWASLSAEERLRRLRIGEEMEPRPHPWWRGMRPGGQP